MFEKQFPFEQQHDECHNGQDEMDILSFEVFFGAQFNDGINCGFL